MLAYRDDSRPVGSRHELARLLAAARDGAASSDAALGLLIDVGILEAALADAVSDACDGCGPLIAAARRASLAAARLWVARQRGEAGDADAVAAALEHLACCALPRVITERVPEGFAYYALFPDAYVEATRAFLAACAPARVSVIGLRSIGTTLAAVVAAALERSGVEATSYTLRPRGHPFAREVRIDARLSDHFREEAAAGTVFLIVDEGPGLSGSSFASAAALLRGLGADVDRIVFLPAWNPPAERLNSPRARAVWETHRRFHVDAATIGITPERLFGCDAGIDYSAGRWRAALYRTRDDWPEVDPAHERWKTFVPREQRLLKFAGLGRFGEAARQRADILADAGLGPRPGSLRGGFLDLPFVPGTPWSSAPGADAPEVVGHYVARVAALFPAEAAVDADAVIAMAATNVREIDDKAAASVMPALYAIRPRLAASGAAAIDGRMLPHEWIATGSGPLKVDALDHHRDHFFPGLQHPAWDLAAAATEFAWPAGAIERMLRAFERDGGDRSARDLLPFYALAYAAFRTAYVSLRGATARARYSQCALNAAACFSASSKSPRKQIARSSMKT